jgi:hypothetical protein
LQEDLKNFEIWLQKVETLIENLTLNLDWSIVEIDKHLNEHKVNLFEDISSNIFKFVLKFKYSKILFHIKKCLQSDIESHARIINSALKLSTKLKQTCIDCNQIHENGLTLQNRWHCLWLKSLEWQCRLEQELIRKKKVRDAFFVVLFFFHFLIFFFTVHKNLQTNMI